ncbi:MAG: hypothetical protein AAF668_09620 [Pseudomonadota bacterium]
MEADQWCGIIEGSICDVKECSKGSEHGGRIRSARIQPNDTYQDVIDIEEMSQ